MNGRHALAMFVRKDSEAISLTSWRTDGGIGDVASGRRKRKQQAALPAAARSRGASKVIRFGA